MPVSQPDIVIAGGGVIGLTTAYFLARAGASVLVLERAETGQEASWAGAGMLPPGNVLRAASPEARLRSLSHSLWPQFASELQEVSGLDNGYHVCGSLLLCRSQQAAFQTAEQWRHDACDAEVQGAEELRLRAPELSTAWTQAVFLPQFAQVRNPRHLKALRCACERSGVRFAERLETLQFEVHESRIQAVRTPDRRFECAQLCLTAGAWTAGLLADLNVPIPIQPVRGQIVQLLPHLQPVSCVIEDGRRYLVPRRDGLVLVGSTEEHVGFQKANTVDGVRGLLEFAAALVPSLQQATITRTWSGLRPGSPDELPLLGRIGGFSNLWIGAGHFRSGLQMSPGTALILSELMSGTTPDISLEGLSPDRFRSHQP